MVLPPPPRRPAPGGGLAVLVVVTVLAALAAPHARAIRDQVPAGVLPALRLPPLPRPAPPPGRAPTPAPQPGSERRCPVDGRVSFVDSWGAPRFGGRRHQGVDMLAAVGTRLVAVEAGQVRWAGWNTLGGLGLSIAGTSGARYYYAHLSARYVAAGARVARGQLVGRVGTSGNAAGGPPHLHFEIRPDGQSKANPYPYVRRWCG
jgi:peptidoglycan LD-endopeptidase LytH